MNLAPAYRPPTTKSPSNLDQWLKRLTLIALIIVLSGFAIQKWTGIGGNVAKAYRVYTARAEAANKAYWLADYWKHHKSQMSADGITFLGDQGYQP